MESRASNARHALGNGDVGEAAATPECRVSNARHALGDGNGGDAAIFESLASNARHAIGHTIVGDGGGDGDGAGVFIEISKRKASLVGYLGLLGLGYEVIPDAVDLYFLRTGHEGHQHCK